MGGDGRGRLGGRAAALVLLVPAGAFLAWQVATAAASGALARRNPIAAAVVAPHDPAVKIGSAMLEFRMRQGHISDAAQRSATDALRDYPIAEEPLFLGAIGALLRKESARGEAMLEEARRRNPRSRLTRLLLLDRYLQGGRTAEATGEIAALTKLVSRTAAVLVPELARLAHNPAQRRTLKATLANDPQLLNSVLVELAKSGADPDIVLDLAGPTSRRVATTTPSWQSLLIGKLVEDGDIPRAYRLWLAFGGRSGQAAPYDGSFEGLPGLPPFNWSLLATSDGVAERAPRGGLQVTYYGRRNAKLASQLLMLQPGVYNIRVEAEGDARGEGSRILWRLSCRGSGESLFELPIVNVSSTPSVMAGAFTVPNAGCSAQNLGLEGVSAEFPSEQNVVLRNLQIARGQP